MKLSDIQGDRVFDVIADIIDPIANIAEDEKASAMFRREKLPEGMTAKQFVTQRVRKALPSLLKGPQGRYYCHSCFDRGCECGRLQGRAEPRETDAGHGGVAVR